MMSNTNVSGRQDRQVDVVSFTTLGVALDECWREPVWIERRADQGVRFRGSLTPAWARVARGRAVDFFAPPVDST